MTDELQKAFEAWLEIAFPHLETYGVEGFNGKIYRSPEAANLAIAYQAGAKHATEKLIAEVDVEWLAKEIAVAEGWNWGGKDQDWRDCAIEKARELQKAIVARLKGE